MTITFFSFLLNHHQIGLCKSFAKEVGVDFRFVQTGKLTEERKRMNFNQFKENYVVDANDNIEEAYRLCMESDVVIAGVVNQNWINERISKNLITFAYKERFLKGVAIQAFSPAFIKNGYLNYFRFRNKKMYFLCASVFTAKDTMLIYPRPTKKFKWGYFPQRDNVEFNEILESKIKLKCLCVARFLDWKRIDDAIGAIVNLRKEGYNVTLDIVGSGEKERKLRELVKINKAENYICFLGNLVPEEVRAKMREADIFIFPSNRKEGWGAVLNEAMSSGCACVASHDAGSSLYLISHGENGLIFKTASVKDLTQKIRILLDDEKYLLEIQKNAYQTIINEWNENIAVKRFIEVCKALVNNEIIPMYEKGPMSRA